MTKGKTKIQLLPPLLGAAVFVWINPLLASLAAKAGGSGMADGRLLIEI